MKQNIKRIGEKEFQYIKEVLDTDFSASKSCGMAQRFEEAFAKKFGSKFAISHVNGTCTMHSALEAINVDIGDEVIVPPLTMSSTSFAVMHANATPIFADINPETFLISPDSINEVITPKTKALITVALYGLSPDMDAIMKISKEHNLTIIEDNAQGFLGKYKGKLLGTIGHMASFSFQSSKHMTAGEGGILITNNEELANDIRCFQSLGYAGVSASKGKITKDDIQDPNYNRHIILGWNYRMPEICAAVCLGQLERLDELVQRRIDVAKGYHEIVKDCSWLINQKVPKECEHSYWTYVVRLENKKISWYDFRKKFIEKGGDGIYAAWKLTYMEPMFQKLAFSGRENFLKHSIQVYKKDLCPNAEEIQPKLLQFKTNYWDWSRAEKNFEALEKTINFFS
jgi:perosamine synthetase